MSSWLLYACGSAVFAGLVAIFGKVGMRDIDSTTATTARSIVMAGSLVVLMLVRGGLSQLSTIPGKSWIFVVLAGLCGATSWLFYFAALKVGDASRVAPIDRLSIIITLVLAWVFLGEKVSGTVILGSVLILGGALLIARG
jgi:transporter family protein